MKVLLSVVIYFICVLSAASADTYRAAIINVDLNDGLDRYLSLISEAKKSGVDILLLPSLENNGSEDNYDETVKRISKAAKQGGLYVVAHLLEKARCQNKNELIRSNLVFDREGAVISVYRKPFNNIANCTSSSSEITTFTTDFGVSFGILMEEDIVTNNVGALKSLKNYIVTGSWTSEIPFLNSDQFYASWAFVTDANLVSNAGIYGGKSGVKTSTEKLLIVDLVKNGESETVTPPVINPTKLHTYPGEDLSQYIIKPLDLEASSQGYKETVCHRGFCCGFYVKMNFAGSKHNEVNYGLAAFDGVRYYGRNRHVGAQNCAIFACAGLYKRSCAIGPDNTTNIIFDKIIISGNFTKENSAQYPVLLTTSAVKEINFNFKTKAKYTKEVTAELNESTLLSFGIFGRDYSRDYESRADYAESGSEGLTSEIYDYLYNEDVFELFDYLWVRLRILLIVVSIYILEML